MTVGELGGQGYDLRRGDLPLPLLVLRESALAHNLRTMHGWCAERGLALAPHGKTTLAPQLIRRQLDAGAWGDDRRDRAPGGGDARRRRAAGDHRQRARRAAEIERLERERARPGSRVLPRRLGRGRGRRSPPRVRARRCRVLIELGGAGARAAATDEQARAVAAAVAAAPRLALAGVEGLEGGLGADREPATLAAVDAFLDAWRLVAALDARRRVRGRDEIVAARAAARYFDRVVERLRSRPQPPVHVAAQRLLPHPRPRDLRGGLAAAASCGRRCELWARGPLLPEPGLAIAGFGKRDAPYDVGLPVVELGRELARGAARRGAQRPARLPRSTDGELRVGDLVVCGISHPCTAFDKWPLLALVDDDDLVIGAMRTLF